MSLGIRSAPRRPRCDGDRLIVRLDDPDADLFVLVTGEAPQFQIRGWMRAVDAKRPEFFFKGFNGRSDAYFVPVNCLHSVDTIGV